MTTVVIKNSDDIIKMQMLLNETGIQNLQLSKPRGYKSCCSSEVVPSGCFDYDKTDKTDKTDTIADQLSKLRVSIPTEDELTELNKARPVPAMVAKNYQPWYSRWFGY